MKFINETITVEAKLTAPDAPQPLAFWWRGDYYKIAGRGRTWRDDAGQHFLVMTPARETFELLFRVDEARWQLVREFTNRQINKSAS